MNTQEISILSEKKNQIQDLLQDIFNEYNRMNETKIHNNCEKDLEMRTMIHTIRTLETSEKEKIDEIRTLKKTIHEYETLINNLNNKLETIEEDKQEENRFDMVRIQAKEISNKDREIERLNGLLNHFKNKGKSEDKKEIDYSEDNQGKIDSVITKVKSKTASTITLQEVVEMNESVNQETGEVNPNFIYEEESKSEKTELITDKSIVKEEDLIKSPLLELTVEKLIGDTPEMVEAPEPEPSPNGSINSNTDLLPVEDVNETVEIQDKGKLIIVTSKKIKYYAYDNESPQTVYEFTGNKVANKPLGTREKNEKGKYKVQLFTS